jgi:hypothetical protein
MTDPNELVERLRVWNQDGPVGALCWEAAARIQADAERIAELERGAEADEGTIETQYAHIDHLRAELAEQRRDAERYRWLRDADDTLAEVDMHVENEDGLTGAYYTMTGVELDTAIDAALAAKGERET